MNKKLRNSLILGGLVLSVFVLAFAAQAAGLSRSNYASMPFGVGMMNGYQNGSAYGSMMGGQNGNTYGYMMSGMINMMGNSQNGHMMDINNMPHHNGTGTGSQDCPYLNQQP